MKVEIYDPPMCCSSGLCGPSVDPALVAINDALLQLKKEGVEVARYMINQHPAAFRSNPDVMRLIKEKGGQCLPITAVNGKVIKYGSYPSYDEIVSNMRELMEGEAKDKYE